MGGVTHQGDLDIWFQAVDYNLAGGCRASGCYKYNAVKTERSVRSDEVVVLVPGRSDEVIVFESIA